MHPTGRDCFGPPTLNRFWTCLCQRIDPKRGVARRGGRAFIPDHSGLRAPFSADSHPPPPTRAPRHSSQTLACRACRASRRTTRTVSAIPPRFRLSPRLRFRVSGRSRIAAARRPDWRLVRSAVDVRSGALGGLTDASTAYIDPANTAAPRAARAYTARYTAASTPRPRAPGCAARRHTTATRTSWLVAVKPTLDILEGLGLASSTLKDPASRTHRAHLTSCRAHLTFAWRGIQGRFHKHNDHRLSSSCGRSRGPRCASQMQPHAATAHQHAIGFCIASSCAAACLTCMPIRFALARVVNTSYSFERRSVAALLPVSCSCLIMFSASSASR